MDTCLTELGFHGHLFHGGRAVHRLVSQRWGVHGHMSHGGGVVHRLVSQRWGCTWTRLTDVGLYMDTCLTDVGLYMDTCLTEVGLYMDTSYRCRVVHGHMSYAQFSLCRIC